MTDQYFTNDGLEVIRAALKSQYRASIIMMRQSVEQCTDEVWLDTKYKNACWQVAYHTLFFTHLYLQPSWDDFKPWEGHNGDVQYYDCFPREPKEGSDLPLIPEPYTREQVLEYCRFLDGILNETIDSLDLTSPESGFSWYKMPKLEHQIVNIRHLHHGVAQLADRLRTEQNAETEWWGGEHDLD